MQKTRSRVVVHVLLALSKYMYTLFHNRLYKQTKDIFSRCYVSNSMLFTLKRMHEKNPEFHDKKGHNQVYIGHIEKEVGTIYSEKECRCTHYKVEAPRGGHFGTKSPRVVCSTMIVMTRKKVTYGIELIGGQPYTVFHISSHPI